MRTIATLIAAAALVAATPAKADHPRSPGSYPRAVSLTDASVPPTFLRIVRPGRGYATLTQCRGGAMFSDMSAYRWNGRKLSAQRRMRDGTQYWRDRRGGRVTFDGLVWQNRTRHAVLIAGWCE